MTEELSLKQKLTAIQAELNCPKTLYNKFGNYYYRNAETILESVKPFLLKYDLSLILNDAIELIGDRFYVVSTATLSDGDTCIITKSYAREPENKKGQDESQVTGAASSYARKYALNAIFLIDDVKDADETNKHGKEDQKPQEQFQKITDINKFLEVWEGGKIYNDKYVYYKNQKFEATQEQVELIKQSPKYEQNKQ